MHNIERTPRGNRSQVDREHIERSADINYEDDQTSALVDEVILALYYAQSGIDYSRLDDAWSQVPPHSRKKVFSDVLESLYSSSTKELDYDEIGRQFLYEASTLYSSVSGVLSTDEFSEVYLQRFLERDKNSPYMNYIIPLSGFTETDGSAQKAYIDAVRARIQSDIIENVFITEEPAAAVKIATELHFSYDQAVYAIKRLMEQGDEELLEKLFKTALNLSEADSSIGQAIKDVWLPTIEPQRYVELLHNVSSVVSQISAWAQAYPRIVECNFSSGDSSSFDRQYVAMVEKLEHGPLLEYIITNTPELSVAKDAGVDYREALRVLEILSNYPLTSEDRIVAMKLLNIYPWLFNTHASAGEWVGSPIGTKTERETTLRLSLNNIPDEHKDRFAHQFNERGVTVGQVKKWLGTIAFNPPTDWRPEVIGEIMFSRLQSGVSSTPHDASFFLNTFQTPLELLGEDSESIRKRKIYIAHAQKWLINYVSTPAEKLVLAWQNRERALAEGTADNPSAITAWAKSNAVRIVLEDSGRKLDFTQAKDRHILSFLTEMVRHASPAEALRVWSAIEVGFEVQCKFIPVKIDLGDGYVGEILRRDDPRGTTIGADTGCCMTIGGVSEECIIAGYTDSRYGFFVLSKDKVIAAQSLLYVSPESSNPHAIVCDNIEVNQGRDFSNILGKYKTFFNAYIELIAPEYDSVNIGEGYSDINLQELQSVLPEERPKTPLAIYSDSNMQRLLTTKELAIQSKHEMLATTKLLDEDPIINLRNIADLVE